MEHVLKIVILFFSVSIAACVLFVIAREGVKMGQRWWFQRKKRGCRKLIQSFRPIHSKKTFQLVSVLKRSFSISVIESLLYDLRAELFLPDVYDQLGLVNCYVQTLKEGRSWTDRARAAERLGIMGHAKGVLPLIATLQNNMESSEVKNVAIRALGAVRDERAISVLIEHLNLMEIKTGQLLADVLIRFGEKALNPLIGVLTSSKSEPQRFWATRVLGYLKFSSALPVLLGGLKDPSLRVRAEAVHSLGILNAKEAIPALSKILFNDPAQEVREAAAEALGLLSGKQDLEMLKRGMADLDYSVRFRAMEALERMGLKSVPLFLEALSGGSAEAATQAAHALERIGIVSQRVKELGGAHWAAAFDFLLLVAKAGVVETVIDSLNHPKLAVRVLLCRVLESARHPHALEALMALAQQDSEWVVRMEALRALVNLANPNSLPVFVQAFAKEEETVRMELLRALKSVPPAFLSLLLDSILPFLGDSNINIRMQTVRLLQKIDADRLAPRFIAILSDPSPLVRRESVAILGTLLPQETVTRALIPLLDDQDREVRIAAVQSLGSLGDSKAIEPLALAFAKADEGYRDDISVALASIPTKEFYERTDILMGFPHPNPKTRAGVVWTLGLTKDQRAVHLLNSFLKDNDPTVRAAAAGALGQFASRPLAGLLLEYLEDSSERVRAAAVNAIGKSGDPASAAPLLAHLMRESDFFVCERGILALGSLLSAGTFFHKSVKTKGLDFISGWLHRTKALQARAISLVALVLLDSKSHFIDLLESMHLAGWREKLQSIVRGLPEEKQKIFFENLALNPEIFWLDEPRKIRDYYFDLLGESRLPQERIRALKVLKTFSDSKTINIMEETLARDPDPPVRVTALQTLGELLKGNALMRKLIEAMHDPSEMVRKKTSELLIRL